LIAQKNAFAMPAPPVVELWYFGMSQPVARSSCPIG
jgi:hypothetical protein